jgi:hypothetical protein
MKLLKQAFTDTIAVGGQSVQIADTTIGSAGGLITNPLAAKDQGIPVAESLWINLLGSAGLSAANGSVELVPGQSFKVPPSCDVWANAATSGHMFSAFFSSDYTVPYPPGIVPGQPGSGTGAILGGFTGGQPFPPPGVTGLTDVIPSYLYQEYSDDDDCQGFVEAQNDCQQDYVDTFNALNLPIYTKYPVEGTLLDWVGAGLYGMNRPALNTGRPILMGPLNTWGCNWIFPNWGVPPANVSVLFGLNELQQLSTGDIVATDDDLYRRILTWHFYKGDGKYFNINFLKRRIWRFLYGQDGIAPNYAVDPNFVIPPDGIADTDDSYIANTQQISVTLGVDQNVSIRFVLGHRTVTGGALLNMFGPNGFEPRTGVSPPALDIGKAAIYLNDLETTYVIYPPLPYMSTFKEALDSGVLEVPYQFNFTCTIG